MLPAVKLTAVVAGVLIVALVAVQTVVGAAFHLFGG